jgi:hypothetical protein
MPGGQVRKDDFCDVDAILDFLFPRNVRKAVAEYRVPACRTNGEDET